MSSFVSVRVECHGEEYTIEISSPQQDLQGDYCCIVNIPKLRVVDQQIYGISKNQVIELTMKYVAATISGLAR